MSKDVYFQPGGGIRTRYFNLWDATGGAYTDNEQSGFVRTRFQLDMQLHKGEFFEAFARLLHAGQWGQQSSAANSGYLSNPAVRDEWIANNGLYLNQGWGLWKVYDSLGIKFGRSPIVVGRGLMYGDNDWFDVPNTFDHLDLRFDWQSVELNIIGAKVQELTTVAGQTVSPDPEENHYIAEIVLKDAADWIKLISFAFAQINRDNGSADGGTTVLPALNAQRLGLDFVFQTRSFVGESYFGLVNGKQRGAVEGSLGQSVIDFKLTYNRPDWSSMSIYGLVHVDSGDNNLDPADTTDKHYDNHYYDVYGRSGRMDFIRWGNLTMFSLGFSIEAAAGLRLGMEYWDFRKTKDVDSPEFGTAARFITDQISAGNIALANNDDIGSEFDLWGNYEFPSGVELGLTMSAFKPGATFRNATSSSGQSVSSTIFQVFTEVKLFF